MSGDGEETPAEDDAAVEDEWGWIDRLERAIIRISKAFAMIVWGMVGAPVWAILICFALLFVIVVTAARAVTGREFSVDRRLLGAVIRFYPNGLRRLKSEFAKIDEALEDNDDQSRVENSYFFSTFQAIGVMTIVIVLYCLYARIDFWALPQYVYIAFAVIVAVALIMAGVADARKKYTAAPAAEPNKPPVS
ncbi:MAG: hypothetical protein U1E61_19460 [Bradyrhizobium sp.]